MKKRTKKSREIWIGLAHVRSIKKRGVLGTASGALVNVLGLAHSKSQFRMKAVRAAEDLGLTFRRMEAAEHLKQRLAKFTIHRELLKLSKGLKHGNDFVFGTFHTYP